MNLTETLNAMGQRARAAARELAIVGEERKNAALRAAATALRRMTPEILAANEKDLEKGRVNGLSTSMLDRLRLDATRVEKMAVGIEEVAALPDPTGREQRHWTAPSGIEIRRVSVPIGVIGIIYESRPNVTSDAAVLCLKAGNAVILRGGSEAFHSNTAIAKALAEGLQSEGLPADCVQLVPTTDREAVTAMARMDDYIDLIIPRGGHALIEAVVNAARMPVIKHFHGVCHVYVDAAADLDMAEKIVINAKCQRPGVCNAMETLLVHADVAEVFLRRIGPSLAGQRVEIFADEEGHRHLAAIDYQPLQRAEESNWTTEYLDLKMSLRVVPSLEQAVDHINRYGSHHSDAIVTTDAAAARRFLDEVDSAAVYWNASTRFTDGGEFGFGAEIGISTDKLHARGPMGLDELTSYKYIIYGEGQIRR